MAVLGLTAEQKREHVLAYLETPFGVKGRYLDEYGISRYQIRRWRSQVYAGTLEVGLVPRGGLMVNDPDGNREVVRLRQENEQLRVRLQEQASGYEQRLQELSAAKQAEIDAGQKTVDALGKAIALLHASSESADSTTGR